MRSLFTISFLFFVICGFSQKEIVLKTKVTGNAVLLRWAPASVLNLRDALKNGYDVKRMEWESATLPTEIEWKNASLVTSVFALESKDTIWKTRIKNDASSAMVYSFLYPDKPMKKEEEQTLFGFTLLSIDMEPALGAMAGMFFKDEEIVKGKKYVYRIEMKNSIKKSNYVAVDTKIIPEKTRMVDWDLKAKGKSVEIKWNFKKHQSEFCRYIIERSSDSVNFTSVSKTPLVALVSQFEKEKTEQIFTDTAVKSEQTYYYRIAGVDHFGETSNYSALKKVYVSRSFKGELVIDTLYEEKENKVNLKFHLTDMEDEKTAVKMVVSRADKINGNYEILRELNFERDSLLLIPIAIGMKKRSNYILLTAFNESGEMIQSWPELILIPDRIPPMVPDSLTGKIDRNGKVFLYWKKNTESDLRGYRVYRGNALHEEFVEVTKNFVLKNKFVDSITVQTLTEDIYYRINAVDSTYNNSDYSIPVKLQKPDYIAPVASPIVEIKAKKSGNSIRWNRSNSKDLLKIEIRRQIENGKSEKVGEIPATDSVNYFIDTNIKNNTGYYYHTVSIDDANNFTESEKVYLYNDLFYKIQNQSLTYIVDREKKKIQLNWTKPDEEVYSYSVYKAKKGETMRFYKELAGDKTSLEDSQLYISNKYVYMVTATLKGGRKVMVGEIVEIEY